MAKDIRIVQVAFNVLDPDQLQLFKYIGQRPNKSGYLKRLVQQDMMMSDLKRGGIYYGRTDSNL